MNNGNIDRYKQSLHPIFCRVRSYNTSEDFYLKRGARNKRKPREVIIIEISIRINIMMIVRMIIKIIKIIIIIKIRIRLTIGIGE